MTVDRESMRRAVVARFPELAGLDVVVHDDGWDSVALEIGATWICKFPRDEAGGDALRREAALLAILHPRLTIAVPAMELIERPSVFTRHRMLPGDGLLSDGYVRLDMAQRDRLARDVAGFLAELHAIEADWAAIGIEADDEDFDADDIARTAWPLLPAELHPAAERVLAAQADLGPDSLSAGLCYLDAHGRNFAFDTEAGRLNGIFDFGDAALVARHEEFIEPAYVSRDFAARVIGAYEAVTGHAIDRHRVATLIGMQRLAELAENADDPRCPWCRQKAIDWFERPSLLRLDESFGRAKFRLN